MILLIDIGNTRTKYLNIMNLAVESDSVDNQSLCFSWLDENWQGATQLVLANVSQSRLTDTIIAWAKQHDIAVERVTSEAQRYGVRSYYHKPNQLGVDRWLALVGAAKLFPKQSVLIVDLGTATTLDGLNKQGQHLGGWILPGIDLLVSSLSLNTTGIDVELTKTPALNFGANSTENVNNGSWASTVGAIELAISQNPEVFDLILLTGGNAKWVKSLISRPTKLVENLIFHGLSCYADG